MPTPGGATESLSTLAVTRPHAASATIEAHRLAFARAGLEATWPRVVALVVQPGVEFDHDKVVDYRPQEARSLSEFISRQSQFTFEAHSTDYQTPGALDALVRDHFAILKVGPGATYALREAIWGLAAIDQALDGDGREPDVRKVVVAVMRSDPATGQPVMVRVEFDGENRQGQVVFTRPPDGVLAAWAVMVGVAERFTTPYW